MAYGSTSLKGKFIPTNPQKYVGDWKDICFRSSWELKYCQFCDRTTNIVKWSSETCVVPYVSPIDGKQHRYFIDFSVWIKNKDGIITKYLVEIKPKSMCTAPKPRKKTKSYIEEVMRWGVNSSKWKAAHKFAESHGAKFMIINEEHLGIKT
jgi:hypothetical protein